MDKKELQEILEQHKLWFNTKYKEGKRADLSGAYLQDADLRNADGNYPLTLGVKVC